MDRTTNAEHGGRCYCYCSKSLLLLRGAWDRKKVNLFSARDIIYMIGVIIRNRRNGVLN